MDINAKNTALVITDPQNDFLSPEGVTWGLVGESVQGEPDRRAHRGALKAAKSAGLEVFVSPHYYYPTDHGWLFGGTVEKMMHDIGMFDRKGALTTEGFDGSGADWLEVYKPYIDDGKTVVVNPHKVYGPETNDLALQLRKRGISNVLLAGMSANLCLESHLRELMEQGFLRLPSIKGRNRCRDPSRARRRLQGCHDQLRFSRRVRHQHCRRRGSTAFRARRVVGV